ncbi:tetratricopeptide repeat protein [Nodosilinea sp. PGN35]|uniref:tetratricopeptide repeat protein n=1 Tax=Nodosilinea sp. PGN35 TaxID=3020489 RepID=UPI0023B2241D|nr:tetratricopeptide repeat protein [Nodosilinea sp. TSF1-S3]MDF0367230.1 tetratricopeptide repeat protein [Nodosilinea sp. TSF1-S3]
MSSQRRLTLFQTLSALPAPQFEELKFVLNPPPGIVPEGMAAQGNRVAALLSWVEGATGCGLGQLVEAVEQLWPGCFGDGEGWGDGGDGEVGGELPWMVPYGRNPYFTGRDEVLATLYRQLRDRQTAAIAQTQAISGLGGIGKTQTAVEYAYRYRDDYRYVFWVGADTELELTSGYVAIAQHLNLPLKNAENQDETVQSVRVWLGREEGWLLIFDNADQPELVQPFLPREIKGHILVTSRAQDFQDLGIVRAIAMETLTPEDAVAFLLTRTGRINPVGANGIRPMQGIKPITDLPSGRNPIVTGSGQSHGIAPTEYTAATDLAAELGYLPLALEQAAAYIVTNRVSFADYLNSYRKQRLKRLEKAKPKLGHYPDSVATTWALNLKEVQKDAPAAAALLNYCAFLHPDAIPFNLFTQGAAELGEPLATALADAADEPLDLYDLLNPLGRYSLIRVEPENQSFSLHRLVQEVIRAELGDDGCKNWVEPLFRAMGQLMPSKDKDSTYQDWPTIAPLVNHVRDLAHYCQQKKAASIAAANIFHVAGTYLLERGRYVLAKPLLQQALELRKSLLGRESKDVATSLNGLARTHELQGRYSEAAPLFQEALAMRKRLLGEKHPDVAISLNNLAALYVSQGRYSEADPLYQEALAMWKRLLGDEHANIATSLNNLAHLYNSQGRTSEAEILYEKALTMRKRLLGNEHPDVAQSLNNLAFLYTSQRRYREAEPFYQEALSMRKLLLGDKHPDVAQSLSNLAALYCNQGRYSTAEPYLKKALRLLHQLLGNEHPNVGRVTDNFGLLYAAQGRTEEARSLYQQALAILEPKLGAEHPWTVRCRENLAKVEKSK